jgi:hypothetical protein
MREEKACVTALFPGFFSSLPRRRDSGTDRRLADVAVSRLFRFPESGTLVFGRSNRRPLLAARWTTTTV